MQSLAEFPIQAVRCRLLVKNGRSEEMLKKDYTGVQCTTFFNMIYDRGLAIFFNESKIEGVTDYYDTSLITFTYLLILIITNDF